MGQGVLFIRHFKRDQLGRTLMLMRRSMMGQQPGTIRRNRPHKFVFV